MVARTGLFVAPLPGTPPVGTAPTDGRLVLGALFGTSFGVLAGGGVVQSASVMNFTVAQTVWALPDVTNAACVFASPTDSVVLTGSAGPGTGSRVDSIAVKQNNYENADADSRANVILVTGIASGSPVAPTLAAGYSRYANIAVPTSAANAAACTVTILAPAGTLALPSAAAVAVPGTLALGTGITVVASYTTKLEKNGNIVTLAFALSNSAITPTATIPSGTSIATLPTGFRPSVNPVTAFLGTNNSLAVGITYTIDTSGVIRAYPSTALGAGATLYASVSFSVA